MSSHRSLVRFVTGRRPIFSRLDCRKLDTAMNVIDETLGSAGVRQCANHGESR
ncbi:hypothetical protein QFZ97_002478 [Paraburkholderia youngii]